MSYMHTLVNLIYIYIYIWSLCLTEFSWQGGESYFQEKINKIKYQNYLRWCQVPTVTMIYIYIYDLYVWLNFFNEENLSVTLKYGVDNYACMCLIDKLKLW